MLFTFTVPGFTSQPNISNIGATSVDITADPATDVNIRCAIYENNAAQPTATEVNSGTGSSSATVGSSNGPVVTVLGAGKTNNGDAHTFSYTGLFPI